MPKTLLLSNFTLLLCFSVLGGSATAAVVDGGSALHGMAPGWWIGTSIALSVVLALTELFSGLRWHGLIAVAAAIAGAVLSDGHGSATVPSACAWMLGWLAVATWFARLAFDARSPG